MDAWGKQYLSRLAVDRASHLEIFSKDFTQGTIPATFAICEKIRLRFAPMFVIKAHPDLLREKVDLRYSGHERTPLTIRYTGVCDEFGTSMAQKPTGSKG